MGLWPWWNHHRAFVEDVYDFFWRRMNYFAWFDIDRIRVYVFWSLIYRFFLYCRSFWCSLWTSKGLYSRTIKSLNKRCITKFSWSYLGWWYHRIRWLSIASEQFRCVIAFYCCSYWVWINFYILLRSLHYLPALYSGLNVLELVKRSYLPALIIVMSFLSFEYSALL